MGRVSRFDVDGGTATGWLDVDGNYRNRSAQGAKDMTTRNNANEQKRFDQAVNERAELIAQARTVLPENFKFDLLSVRQIREAALKEMNSTLELSGKSDDYVHGHFDQVFANTEKRRAKAAGSQRSDSETESGMSRSRMSRIEALRRMDARDRKLGTPACLEPLAYTKDARGAEKLESWEQPLEVGQTNTGKTYGFDGE